MSAITPFSSAVPAEDRTSAGSPRLLVFARVVAILALWVLAFVAFLLAPVIVLLVAWAVGFGYVAIRRARRDRARGAAAGPSAHRFGAQAALPARSDSEGASS